MHEPCTLAQLLTEPPAWATSRTVPPVVMLPPASTLPYTLVDVLFTLTLPFPFDAAIGDTYSAIAGCRKRLTEDCKTRFANVLNFQGEPHLPGIDLLTKVPGVGT